MNRFTRLATIQIAALFALTAPAAAQWRAEAFASAGLSCGSEVSVDELGVYDDAGVRSESSSWYVSRERPKCRPAVTTGMVFGRWPETGRLGYGVGVHMCACNGDTDLYPAVTVHVGRIGRQAYVGASWTPRDVVRFPNGQDNQHLARGIDTDQFIIHEARNSVRLLVGFVVGATNITGGGS